MLPKCCQPRSRLKLHQFTMLQITMVNDAEFKGIKGQACHFKLPISFKILGLITEDNFQNM